MGKIHEEFRMYIRSRALPLVLIIFFLFASVACTLSSKIVEINGSSMEPTYPEGTRLRIVEIDPTDLNRGDLVYYEGPGDDTFFVKRLVGLPGETVEIVEGVVYIDGTLLEEDYPVTPNPYSNGPCVLEEDEYFVLGDNRTHSLDSRSYGPIRASQIKGIALPTD